MPDTMAPSLIDTVADSIAPTVSDPCGWNCTPKVHELPAASDRPEH